MIRFLATCLLLCGMTSLFAADAVSRFQKAMGSQDFQEKKAAIAALSTVKDDAAVYQMLIQALNDRQAKDLALQALRSRASGSTPPPPEGSSAGDWSSWNTAREKVLADAKALDAARSTAEEAKQKADELAQKDAESEQAEAGETTESEDAEDPAVTAEADSKVQGNLDHLGKLDRVIFHDGTILIAYVTVKRRDLTGRLTSLHVVHKDGAGEEDIDAALVTRIQEDIE